MTFYLTRGRKAINILHIMGKIRRIRIKPKQSPAYSPGESPGSLKLPKQTPDPEIKVHSYNEKEYTVAEVSNSEQLKEHLKKYASLTHWIQVSGPANLDLLNCIEERFGVHKLVLEDIINTRQRPKLDEYENYIFAVSRMLFINPDLEIENQQISFLVFDKLLISFHESTNQLIAPVVQRLKGGKGNIRKGGASYMMYSVMDANVDNYFTLIHKLGDELETIEELLYRRPKKSMMYEIQGIKRVMMQIRRAIWPERDKVNDMIRSTSPLITTQTKTFLRDVYDHCMQLIDLVESYKDITTSLIDMNLAFLSNRMNEIIKVLTIISSIFIPLTFVAGVYGMNFAYQDPETGRVLHKNMPELYAENGYIYTMAIMLLIAILQLIYFWQKGWLSNR